MQAQAAAAQARAEAATAQQAAEPAAAPSDGQPQPPPAGGGSVAPRAPPDHGAGAGSGNNGGARRAPRRRPRAGRAASIPAASSRAGTAVNAAMSQLGVAYRFAAATPGVAFDCSGLTSWAWGAPASACRTSPAQQYASVPHVPASAAQPGDLMFFYSPISHVGIYLGGGQMVDAPNSGAVVRRAAVNWGNVVGVGRPG